MPGRRTATLTIGVLVMFAAALVASDTTREQTLQKAIDLLEKNDFTHALPLLEEVVKSPDPMLAVRGLMYLAHAQERQGADRARAIYQRVVNEFGNQTGAVTEARRRLEALGGASDNLAQVKVMPDADSDGSLSPDGRSVALIDWDHDGDIGIQDVATGKIRRLFARAETSTGDEYGEWAALSPDMSKVLFLWDPAEKRGGDYQLRVMSTQPGSNKAQVLFQLNKEIQWMDTGVWFPDNQSVLVQGSTSNHEWQWIRISVADKKSQVIKSLQWRLQGVRGRPSISPDGRYIAYAALANNPSKKPATRRPSPPDSLDQYIYVLPADGQGMESVVTRSPGINESPVWSKDGSHLLFISDRPVGNQSGSFGLWSVEMTNGQARGGPSPVRVEVGRITPMGVTSSGSYYYVRGHGGVDVFTAELQSGGTALRNSPVRVTEVSADSNTSPAWSPDGKQIAFMRQRPASTANPNARLYDLVVYTQETHEEEIYSYNNLSDARPVWFHDGKHLLTMSGGSLFRVDLKTHAFRSIEAITHSALPANIRAVSIAANDNTLYVAAGEEHRENEKSVSAKTRFNITSFSMTTGDENDVYSSNSRFISSNIALSPDGRTLAFIWQPEGSKGMRLARVGVDGGNFMDLGPSFGPAQLTWTADGRILFRTDDASRQNPLALISPAGGKLEYIAMDTTVLSGNVDLNPDASRAVFVARTSKELWKVDNLASTWRSPR